jgi:hypothetical protein
MQIFDMEKLREILTKLILDRESSIVANTNDTIIIISYDYDTGD